MRVPDAARRAAVQSYVHSKDLSVSWLKLGLGLGLGFGSGLGFGFGFG